MYLQCSTEYMVLNTLNGTDTAYHLPDDCIHGFWQCWPRLVTLGKIKAIARSLLPTWMDASRRDLISESPLPVLS